MNRFVRNAIAIASLLFNAGAYGQSTSCAEVNFNHADTLIFNCVPNDTCVGLTALLPDIRQTANAPNAYLVQPVSYSGHYPFQMTGATQVLVNQDDAYSGIINLPFTFCFYGGQYNQIVIGANGTLSFHELYANQSCGFEMCSNGTWYPGPANPGIPNNFSSSQWGWDSYPRNAIFACFQDIDPSLPAVNKGIEWKLEGAAPCRKLIVNWRNIPQFSCTSNTTTFQCVLYENTNAIEIYVAEKPACTSWNCGYAVIGVQNDARTQAIAAPGRNGAVWTTNTSNSEGWRFIPNGPSLLQQVALLNSSNQVVSIGTVSAAQAGQLSASFNNACVGGVSGDIAKYYVKADYISCSNPMNGFGALDSIVLIKNPITPSPTTNSINYCQNQPTLPLSAAGVNLKWYTTANGGVSTLAPPTPSSATAGTFTWYVSQTVDNCESYRAPISVMISPYKTGTKTVTICPGQSYTFNGQNYTTAQSGLLDTFATATCDSIVTLNINVIPFVTNTVNATICQGASYTYNNVVYTTATTTTHTFANTGGCDSVVTFNLTTIPFVTGQINATICQGQTHTYNGHIFSSDTTFVVDTFTTSSGCDSIVTFQLHVTPYKTGTIQVTICQNQSYTVFGHTYTASFLGNLDTVQTAGGCDSIIALNLTVIPFVTGQVNATICQGQSYTFNNVAYSASIYGPTDTFVTAAGCDSIVTLNLTVNPYITSVINASICPGHSYFFNGVNYTNQVSGASDTFQTSGGCDSIVYLNLYLTPYMTGLKNVNICQGQTYTFNGITYNSSVTGPTDTVTTLSGCDSIIILNLSVSAPITGVTNATVCAGQSYTYNGTTYTSSVSGITSIQQNVSGCDSIHTFNLTVLNTIRDTVNAFICQGSAKTFNGITYTSSISGLLDTFQSANGCDSIVTLNLTVNPWVYTTEEYTVCPQQMPFAWRGKNITQTGYSIGSDTIPASKGCDSIVLLNLHVLPLPIVYTLDTAGCEELEFENNIYYKSKTLYKNIKFTNGDCDSVVYVTNIEINYNRKDTTYANICIGDKYTYNGNDYTSSGYFAHRFYSSKGCDSLSVLKLVVHDLPNINLYFDEADFCIYDTVRFNVSGATQYTWQYNNLTKDGGDFAYIPLSNFENVIGVKGVDNNSCVDSAMITVDTRACCDMDMPNAFSPNGDGLNDYFKPVSKGNPLVYNFYIYNRLGQKIFQSSNIDKGWDGTFNGNPVEMGVYHFWLVTDCANGEKKKLKGDVTLIR